MEEERSFFFPGNPIGSIVPDKNNPEKVIRSNKSTNLRGPSEDEKKLSVLPGSHLGGVSVPA